MEIYGKYHAVKRIKSRWVTVATVTMYGESCTANAQSFFDVLGIKYDSYVRDSRRIENQSNWKGFSDDCIHFNVSYESFHFVCSDIYWAMRHKKQLFSTLRIKNMVVERGEDAPVYMEEAMKRYVKAIAGMEAYI